MNGPQRTAVSRKELWQKRKQQEFLINNQYQLTIPMQWAAQWLHPWQCYMSDKWNTDRLTDNIRKQSMQKERLAFNVSYRT